MDPEQVLAETGVTYGYSYDGSKNAPLSKTVYESFVEGVNTAGDVAGKVIPGFQSLRNAVASVGAGQFGNAAQYAVTAAAEVGTTYLTGALAAEAATAVGAKIATRAVAKEAGKALEAAGKTASKGGNAPVLKGQAGVNLAIADVEANGGTVLGREITLDAGGVRTRPDLFVRDAQGNLKFIEVKNGPGARLTPNQTAGFPLIQGGGAVPRGGNAAGAGLEVGQPLPPTPVEVWRY